MGGDLNLELASHDFYEPRTAPLGGYYVRVPTSFSLNPLRVVGLPQEAGSTT
ncbi:MAG: hypothetical protein WKG07_04015 [Hymenobacter sp.]